MISEPDFVVNRPEEPPSDVRSLLYNHPTDIGEATSIDADLAETQANWPIEAQAWREEPAEGQAIGELMPGMWTAPFEYGIIPRMRVLEGWNPDVKHTVPPMRPTCLSTHSTTPAYNMTPSSNEGWEFWVHEEHQDKPYLLSRTPGARVQFELDTSLGVIKLYSLRSKTFGLGNVECWVDHDKGRSVRIPGWWDSDMFVLKSRDSPLTSGISAALLRFAMTCNPVVTR